MAEVKALVRGGITICATIHSPTPFAFALFDSLMILLRGRVVYFGDRGAWPHPYPCSFSLLLPTRQQSAFVQPSWSIVSCPREKHSCGWL